MSFFNTAKECTLAIECLKSAKGTIAKDNKKSSKSEYICDNVRWSPCDVPPHIRDKLREWISTSLGGRFGLEKWLKDVHNIAMPTYGFHDLPLEVSQKLQNTRLAWMDWMIHQLEIKREVLALQGKHKV